MIQHPNLIKIMKQDNTTMMQGRPTPRVSVMPPAGRSNQWDVGRLQVRIEQFPWSASNPYSPIRPNRGAEAIPKI